MYNFNFILFAKNCRQPETVDLSSDESAPEDVETVDAGDSNTAKLQKDDIVIIDDSLYDLRVCRMFNNV